MTGNLASNCRKTSAALFGAVFIVALVGLTETAATQEKFNRDRWIEAGKGTDWQVTEKHMKCIRGPMLKDLRTNYLKTGMSKDAVFHLMGRPDERLRSDPRCFSYTLGFCRSPIDYDSFGVCFDEHDRLMRN